MLVIEMKNLNKQKNASPVIVKVSQSSGALAVRRMTSDELLAGQREIVIEHASEEYRLRITSKGKLILKIGG